MVLILVIVPKDISLIMHLLAGVCWRSQNRHQDVFSSKGNPRRQLVLQFRWDTGTPIQCVWGRNICLRWGTDTWGWIMDCASVVIEVSVSTFSIHSWVSHGLLTVYTGCIDILGIISVYEVLTYTPQNYQKCLEAQIKRSEQLASSIFLQPPGGEDEAPLA